MATEATRGLAYEELPAASGAASVHPEGEWEAKAVGDTDDPRPSGANGHSVDPGTDFRSGFSGLFVRISARAECAPCAGGDSRAFARGLSSGVRRRPEIVFRHDTPRETQQAQDHRLGQVLQAVAKTLDETIRKMDFVGRYGGEEFAVIAPECNLSKASSLAERLREAVEELQLEAAGQKLRVTISIGVAFVQWPGYERSPAELIKAADAKLYEAKRGGRNCCRLEEALKQAA